jgi:hypothetical protein
MMYTSARFRFFMTRGFHGTDHVRLVVMKAMRAPDEVRSRRYRRDRDRPLGFRYSVIVDLPHKRFGVLEGPASTL